MDLLQPTARLTIDIPQRRIGALLQAQEQEIQAQVQAAIEHTIANYDFAAQMAVVVRAEMAKAIHSAVSEWLASQPAKTAINAAVAARLQAAIDSLGEDL